MRIKHTKKLSHILTQRDVMEPTEPHEKLTSVSQTQPVTRQMFRRVVFASSMAIPMHVINSSTQQFFY